MHCPQCGQPPPSEQTRYCTLCGFALGPLKELMSSGTPPGSSRQRDITLGAGLMLIGAFKAFLISVSWSRGRSDATAVFSLGVGAFFGLLELFFQFSPRQKGLSLGATLMFVAALAAWLAGMPTEGVGALAVLTIAIPLILFWKRLAAGFSKLFFDKIEGDEGRKMPQAKPPAALPAPQATAIDLDTGRVKQAAAFEPLSVIEGTTKTLGVEKLSETSS